MRYRAQIQRAAAASDGGGGQTKTWPNVDPALPCWAFVKTLHGGHLVERGEHPTSLSETRVLVPAGGDVRVGDRVTVRNRRQDRVLYPTMTVDSIAPHDDHVALICRTLV